MGNKMDVNVLQFLPQTYDGQIILRYLLSQQVTHYGQQPNLQFDGIGVNASRHHHHGGKLYPVRSFLMGPLRSEERRVGKEWRSRWWGTRVKRRRWTCREVSSTA